MSFSRKVHNRVNLADGFMQKRNVTNVTLYESVTRVVFQVMQACRVCAYAHLVQIYQLHIWMRSKHVPAKVATDEA